MTSLMDEQFATDFILVNGAALTHLISPILYVQRVASTTSQAPASPPPRPTAASTSATPKTVFYFIYFYIYNSPLTFPGSTRPLSGHTGLVRCLDSKRGILASGSNDGTVKLWRWSDTCIVRSIDFHDRVWTLSFSSDAAECLVATTGFNQKGIFLSR